MWDELYHETIMEHSQHSPYRQLLQGHCDHCSVSNPLCGDEITLQVQCVSRKIHAIAFEGQGCAISQASASMVCAYLKDLNVEHALDRINAMLLLLTGETDTIDIEELMALSNIKRYPMRVKCATMAWHAARGLLKDK